MGIEEDSLKELKALNQNINNLTRALGKSAGSSSFGASQSARRDGARQDDDDEKKILRRNTKEYRKVEKNVASYNALAAKWLKATGRLTQNMVDSTGNFTSNIDEANKDLDEMRKAWSDSADAIFDMREKIDRWGTSQTALNSQTTRLVAGMSRFTSNMAKTTKAQSLLYAEQMSVVGGFKDFEKAAYFDELSKSVSSLSNVAKARLNLIDKSTGQLRADLDLSDFQNVRQSLGEVEASMKEMLSNTDFKSFTELFEKGKFVVAPGDHDNDADATAAAMGADKASINRETLVKVAAMLQARGLHTPKVDSQNVLDKDGKIKNAAELNKIDWAGLAQSISVAEKSFGRATKNLDKSVDEFQEKWSRLLRSLQNEEGRAASIDSLKTMVGTYLSSAAAFSWAKEKLMKAAKEISDFNIAQIPASYLEVNSASVKLGLSFKDTVKLMDENKRILAIYGPKQFTSSMGNMVDTFKKYGYTMEQAASMVGPTVESAIASGINVRDPAQLNKFTDNMMGQFQKVSGMVKISAEEFAALNKNLFQAEGTFETMLGMDTQRRQAYAQELVQLRTKYVAQGLEIQQANELIKAQQEQQRGRLKDRTSDAAKLLTAAQLSGLGASAAMEVYQLASKGRRTDQEQARLAELAGQINQGLETKTNQGYGASGNNAMGDIYNEARLDLQTSGAMGQITKAGSQIQVSKEAGAQVSEDEQKRASAAAKGNEQVAALGQAINTVSSVINNAFLGSIVASSVALVAFGYQVAKVSALMGGKGGILGALTDIAKGYAGDIKSKLPGAGGVGRAAGAAAAGAEGAAAGAARTGVLGKAAGALGKVGGVLGKIAGPAAVGLAAISAFSDLSETNKQKDAGEITEKQATVKKSGILGGLAAGGAAGLIGAGIGQALIPIPGVGAIIGGAVGSALGGWLGKSGSEAIADAVVSDTTAKPTTDVKTKVDQKPLPAVEQKVKTIPAMPVAPNIPKVGVDQKVTQTDGINTNSQDKKEILGVQDADALEQLRVIAASIAAAVQLLQQLSDQKGTTQAMPDKLTDSIVRTPFQSNPMNTLPSAYDFTTGRTTKV